MRSREKWNEGSGLTFKKLVMLCDILWEYAIVICVRLFESRSKGTVEWNNNDCTLFVSTYSDVVSKIWRLSTEVA